MGEKLVGDDFARGAQLVDGASEIDGVPEDDGGDREIEARGAVALILESPIADLAEAMKEHGPLESVVRLALVEAGAGAPAQCGVADPVEREQRALQASDFPQRFGDGVLARIGGEASHERRGRDGSGLDRRARAQDFIPGIADDTHVDCPADDRRERFVFRAGVQDIAALIHEACI